MDPWLTGESLYKVLFLFIQNMTYLFPSVHVYVYVYLAEVMSTVTSRFHSADEREVTIR